MREDELFHAYRMLKFVAPEPFADEERRENIFDVMEATRRIGYKKCQYGECPTLISLDSERDICRYHLRRG